MRARGAILLVLLCVCGVGVFPACDNVDTGDPAPADDDDGSTGTPTATPTATGTPTGTPTPAPSLSGDPWTATADPPNEVCSVIINVQFGVGGTAVIGVATTGNDLYFDIGLHLDPAIGIAQEPSGTVDANGDFTQTFSYCTFDGGSTTRYAGDWSGTFDAGMTTFDSTLTYQLYVETGDLRAMCASVDNPFGDCTSPGVTFSVAGVKQ